MIFNFREFPQHDRFSIFPIIFKMEMQILLLQLLLLQLQPVLYILQRNRRIFSSHSSKRSSYSARGKKKKEKKKRWDTLSSCKISHLSIEEMDTNSMMNLLMNIPIQYVLGDIMRVITSGRLN